MFKWIIVDKRLVKSYGEYDRQFHSWIGSCWQLQRQSEGQFVHLTFRLIGSLFIYNSLIVQRHHNRHCVAWTAEVH